MIATFRAIPKVIAYFTCTHLDRCEHLAMVILIRGEAIMLVKLSIILFSNSHNFTYYSQNYAWFNAHSITDN